MLVRPSLVRAEVRGGYATGNHTWNHPDMAALSAARQAAEMDKATAGQWSITRTAPCAFRPPYGNYDSATLRLARQRRMGVWLWSADTQDWMAGGSGSAYWVHRIIRLAEAEGGALRHPIVLMHNQPAGTRPPSAPCRRSSSCSAHAATASSPSSPWRPARTGSRVRPPGSPLLGVGAMNSPRYSPAGLLIEHGQVRVAIDGGPGAEPAGPLAAWLVTDERAELIREPRRLAAAHGLRPAVRAYRADRLVITPLPVVHTSHPAYGYLIGASGTRTAWAPEFLFPSWAAAPT
jgi:hypothetical protein